MCFLQPARPWLPSTSHSLFISEKESNLGAADSGLGLRPLTPDGRVGVSGSDKLSRMLNTDRGSGCMLEGNHSATLNRLTSSMQR